MIIKTSSILLAAVIAGGTAGATNGILQAFNYVSPYLPFLVGGLTLYFWLVTHDEVSFSLKEGAYVVMGAMLMGWLAKGLTGYMGELAFQAIYHTIPQAWLDNSEKLRSGSIVDDVTTAVGFGLGAFSRLIINRFFSNREKIVDKLEKKVGVNNDS